MISMMPGQESDADIRRLMTKPWSEVRARYARLVHEGVPLASMLELVSRIEKSRYAKGLFASTSMHDLCIVQMPVTNPHDAAYLRVSPLSDGQLEFRYIDTYIKDRQWHRTVAGADGFSRLERFIGQLHWFPPEPRKEGEMNVPDTRTP